MNHQKEIKKIYDRIYQIIKKIDIIQKKYKSTPGGEEKNKYLKLVKKSWNDVEILSSKIKELEE